jgi:hypothetical protein
MNREDVVRISESVIRDLKLELEPVSFVDPNSRTIVLKYKDQIIDSVWFDVRDKREYEG